MPRTIKKYANRRLYDTQASRHVTLDGIRQLVASGEDVVVMDDTTGQDITRSILLQVITEQEQGGRPILSAEMLKHIIRFYGNPLQDMMGGYLERSVEVFMGQQKVLQDQIQKTMGMAPLSMTPLSTMQSMAQKNLEAWGQMQKTFLDMLNPPGSASRPAAPTPPEPSSAQKSGDPPKI
ncbi:MAG: polyhydroxyalkanoate synthesis repressor PhaR [Gammaproteobacteria bacterium]|nr:polyhydroxyalkanoate synthesis repressor PhaR [Gammaproteobacteria bacterium]